MESRTYPVLARSLSAIFLIGAAVSASALTAKDKQSLCGGFDSKSGKFEQPARAALPYVLSNPGEHLTVDGQTFKLVMEGDSASWKRWIGQAGKADDLNDSMWSHYVDDDRLERARLSLCRKAAPELLEASKEDKKPDAAPAKISALEAQRIAGAINHMQANPSLLYGGKNFESLAGQYERFKNASIDGMSPSSAKQYKEIAQMRFRDLVEDHLKRRQREEGKTISPTEYEQKLCDLAWEQGKCPDVGARIAGEDARARGRETQAAAAKAVREKVEAHEAELEERKAQAASAQANRCEQVCAYYAACTGSGAAITKPAGFKSCTEVRTQVRLGETGCSCR